MKFKHELQLKEQDFNSLKDQLDLLKRQKGRQEENFLKQKQTLIDELMKRDEIMQSL